MYSDAATREYTSLEAREARARSLLNDWESLVYHEPTGEGQDVYYFASDRAGDCPYRGFDKCHVVSVQSALNPPTRPPLPSLPNVPSTPPSGGTPAPTRSTVFVAHPFQPGLPPQILRAQGRTDFSSPNSPLGLPWLTAEQFAPGVNPTSSNEAVNLIRIVAPASVAGQSLNQLSGGYWVGNGKVYQPNGFLVILFRYVPLPGGVVPINYTFDANNRQFLMPSNANAPLESNGFPVNTTATPLGVDPNNPFPPDPPLRDPFPPPDRPSPDAPRQRQYACTCPDATRRQERRPDSPYPSEWSDRDWGDSDAGAPVDEVTGVAWCKHAIAVAMYRGEW